MATAEASKPVKFKKLKLPVHFGGVSIGEDTAAIGITLTHEDLAIKSPDTPPVLRAYELLCTRRLKVILTLGRRDEGETQGKLLETDITINGTCDTNSLGVTTKSLGSRLSFALSEVNASDIAQFAKRDGFMTIASLMEQLADDEDKSKEDEETGEE